MNKKLLAFSLGDGHVRPNGELDIKHCLEQKEYCLWKYEQLREYCTNNPPREKSQGQYDYITFNTRHLDSLKEIRKKLYGVLGKKYFSKEIVDNMDWFSFAVLYMDDGSLTAKKREGKIHAYDLVISIYGEKSECENLINKLNSFDGLKFGLKFNKNKYSIRCGTKSARKFLEYIKPYCPNFKCFSNTKFKPILVGSNSETARA